MGAGESTYVINQENFVKQNFQNVKSQLPYGSYNDAQIKGKLREQYAKNKNGGYYNEKDRWISDSKWKKVRF